MFEGGNTNNKKYFLDGQGLRKREKELTMRIKTMQKMKQQHKGKNLGMFLDRNELTNVSQGVKGTDVNMYVRIYEIPLVKCYWVS